jgi:hypothetical protein
MITMSISFIKSWAIIASAFALILLGVLIGQRLGQAPDAETVTEKARATELTAGTDINTNTDGTSSTDGGPGDEPVAFLIPAAFTSIPSEWHTIIKEDSFDGYAILFDPPRREVIIEKCRHPGYFDPESGQPLPEGMEFCTNVLWGQILVMDEQSAVVQARNGEQLKLTLSLTAKDEQSHLALSFPGHQMNLVPGSKNDLFQALERNPVMVKQKQQKIDFWEADYQKRRQQQLKTAEENSNG